MIPKFRWMLHYHTQPLLNCFCLERKHRVPKRYAGDLTNISKYASQSLLMECSSHHLCHIARPDAFNFEVGLVGGRPASKRLHKLVSEALDTGHLNVKYSVESRFSKLATCRKSDLVLVRVADESRTVAKVLGHFDVGGTPITMTSMYKFIEQDTDRSSIWEPIGNDSVWILTMHC